MHSAVKLVPAIEALLDHLSEKFQTIDARLSILETKGQRPVTKNNRLLRVKLGNQFGSDLEGHWFWLDPADEYAEKALGERYFRPEDKA